jgi:gliding motility-associated lipoprotein GldH
MREANNLFFVLFGAGFILLFWQCNQSNEINEIVSIDNHWLYNKPAQFIFTKKDDKPKKIRFLVRNNNEYEFRNLYFFVHQTDPDGIKQIDTLQYFLASETGEWLGAGMTQVKSNFLEATTIKKKGKYKIEVFQAMRKDELNGIEDITLTIN